MTRQPAVQGCVLLLVAVYAECHLKVNLNQTVVSFHVAVAHRTIDIGPNMGLVIELHVVGNVVDPHPGHRRLCVKMPSFLHDLRVLGNDVRVTEKTERHGRNARILRSIDIRMAEATTDLLVPCVDSMTEVDWLNRADRPVRVDVVKVKHHPKQDRYKE